MKIRTTLIALMIVSSFSVAQAEVDTKPLSSAADVLYELQSRQADLLASSNELFSLRVQYAHAQLWYLYHDIVFIYWSQELKLLLLKLEQINSTTLSTAIQSLAHVAVNTPDTTPCTYFGNNSLECSITTIQSINNWLLKRNQQIFSATGAASWFADWAKRWQQTLQRTAGYMKLKQDMDQFLVDNPDFPVYFQLQHDFSVKSAELFNDTAVAAKVNSYAHQLSTELQGILSKTEYTAQMKQYNQRTKILLEADPAFLLMKQDAYRLAKLMDNLMLGVHTTVVNCTNWGNGNRCFDPQFNSSLQTWLPSSNSSVNQTLFNSAKLTEKYYQFLYDFTQDPEVQALQEETADTLQATLEPVLTDLQDAKETYIERLLSIDTIHDQLSALWDQLIEMGEQLGFIN